MSLIGLVQAFVDKVNSDKKAAVIIVQAVAVLDGVKLNSSTEDYLIAATATGLAVVWYLQKRLAKLTAAPAKK